MTDSQLCPMCGGSVGPVRRPMKATTADIIAALRGDRAALERVRCGHGSWSRTVEGIVAADRLAELDAILTAINEKDAS